MSGDWVIYNSADEDAHEDCFVVAEVKRGTEPLLPAHCKDCGCSTMVARRDDGWFDCLRCGEAIGSDDIKPTRTEAALMEEIAAALFPAVCEFCHTEMIGQYARIGIIDCGGYGECEREKNAVIQ